MKKRLFLSIVMGAMMISIGGCKNDITSATPSLVASTMTASSVITSVITSALTANPSFMKLSLELSDAIIGTMGTVEMAEEGGAEEVSQEQLTYEAAQEAEEKGYYKVAETLYESIKGYEDATEKYNEIKNFLAQFDGTYYGESTTYNNVYVYLYISDGVVTAQFEGQDMSASDYELYQYGTLSDGEPFMAFASAISFRYSASNKLEYDDGVAIREQSDGSYFVAPVEGSSCDTWNGFYEKIR